MKHAWALLLGVILVAGCAHAARGETHRLVYVDGLTAPKTAIAGKPVTVTLAGTLPTPAWQLGSLQLARADHRITITLWADLKHHGPSIEMLVPFKRAIALGPLTPGDWTVQALGNAHTRAVARIEVR